MSTQREIQKTECPNSDQQQHFAIFFISTGRCGTQWLASSLGEHYSDLAEVTHEPMQVEYEPRRLFQAWHHAGAFELPRKVEDHLARIESVLKNRHYVETGWPVYGALPVLMQRLHGKVRVIHLVRCPLRVAASLTTHEIYSRGPWTDAMVPSPKDCGVRQNNIEPSRWAEMPEFEKALFWWGELNSYANRLRDANPSVPWMFTRYRDLFGTSSDQPLHEVLNYIGLPRRETFFSARETRIDNFHKTTSTTLNVDAVKSYPLVIDLMRESGYELDRSVSAEVRKRYRDEGLLRRGRRLLRRVLGLTPDH